MRPSTLALAVTLAATAAGAQEAGEVRARAQRHLRHVCPGPVRREHPVPRFHGMERDALVLGAQDSLDTLLAGRRVGLMYIVCYLRQRAKVFETYWTTRRGVEAMDNIYRLLDLTVYGRQEKWEDSPSGWPQAWGESKQRMCTEGRPIAILPTFALASR